MPKITEKKTFSAHDRAVLSERGISEAAAKAEGIYTEMDSVRIAAILNKPTEYSQACEGCLVIPFPDADGGATEDYLVRPHNPRKNKDGKLIKYESPTGQSRRAYFSTKSIPHLKDPKTDLHVVEGPLKAIALSQYDYCVIGINGVYGWGSDELIDDLKKLPIKGRTIILEFDYDPKQKTRDNVDLALKRFARALYAAGASKVKRVKLPPGAGGTKNGVDDYLVAQGIEAFRKLVEKAVIVSHSESTGDVEEVDAMDLKNADDPEGLESLPLLGADGLIIKTFATALSAPPKAGKTELMYPSVAEWLQLGELVLYFTEEPKVVWQQRLRDLDIITERGLSLVFGLGAEVQKLIDRAANGSESVVVIDTLRGLGVLGEDENDNSAVARCLEPWLSLCRQGSKTLVMLHHDRKTGGSHGQAVSGAHSLVGSVDMLLQLRHGKKENQRVVTALGRLVKPDPLTYERQDDGTMIVVGREEPAPKGPKLAVGIMKHIPSEPPGITLDDLIAKAECAKKSALDVVKAKSVTRTGTGKKGDPFLYFRG